ncbi:MAG: cytochrome c [Planctomycetaceae bacterium]|nr:cytochrome c [Planctomycetaceae bacterium]
MVPTTAAQPEVTIVRPKLPDDVFFQDPLAIAANRTRVPGLGKPTETVRTTEPGATGEPATATETVSDAPVDWAALLPAELLVAEANRIRERFTPKLASVATFNSSLLDVPPYAAELAALGGIATEHGGNIPWKTNAKYVRDLSAEMIADQLQRGQKSYEQVKVPFDKISLLLDGKRPEGLPEADDATDFAISADFGFLMRRFEAAQNYLKTTGGSDAAFKQNAADLVRETRVLAALSKVIAHDDHGYGDDAKFQGYANAMTEASLAAATAAEKGDFAAFDLAASNLAQSCVKCHGDYRNN